MANLRLDLDRRAEYLSGPFQDNTQVSIEVRTAQQFQVWNGFGAAVSELGAKSLAALPAAERDRFFVEAFSKEQGLGLDWIRLPVGASDFALDAYSHSMTSDDFEMKAFSYLADTLCFRNPDGSVALFLENLEAARTANLLVDGKAQTLQLPERSLCVFRVE
jgi:O-glycosyl hydrolase